MLNCRRKSTIMKHTIESILQSLGLPPTSQKIYKTLLESGETTARFLSDSLSITRPSTYDHLHLLIKKGLVVQKKKGTTTYFMPDDVRHIKESLEESITQLQEKKTLFETMLPKLLKETSTVPPRITFYEGREGLTRIMNDVLWSKGITIYTLWPYHEMLRVLGKEPLIHFNNRRLQEKITIHALWPHNSTLDNDYIWNGKDTLTIRKKASKDFTFQMGYTIYGDKVSFISSHLEVFGFIVQSKDFSDLMRAQFEVLWKTSKK